MTADQPNAPAPDDQDQAHAKPPLEPMPESETMQTLRASVAQLRDLRRGWRP
ncbi:hypothetical protein [Kitasatospora sp. Root107]|uniref:hypothetical protein n=1 Tax=Kitasatospora sp. Root107 TaxID=1736424 RepID=UPI000B195468|nr:hypothetical protein [Kitasatospora sp. Root107]